MMNKIVILKYNNYYNRIWKRELSVDEYIAASAGSFQPEFTVNFYYADGITSELVMNYPAGMMEFSGDYLLVCDESMDILHRWFILESRWNRQRQFTLTLRRDVLVDFFGAYTNAKFLCKRGIPRLPNGIESTELFNTEGIQYSQIKEHQIELEDISKCACVVLYLAKDRKGPDTFTWTDEDGKEFTSTGFFISPEEVGSSESMSFYFLPDKRPEGGATKTYTSDAVYDILCIPFVGYESTVSDVPDLKLSYPTGGTVTRALGNKKQSLAFAANAAEKLGAHLFDAQIIPYFPTNSGMARGLKSVIVREKNAAQFLAPVATSIAPDKYVHLGFYGFFAESKDFVTSAEVVYPYTLSDIATQKVDAECRTLRVCAPDGSSMFEFNAVKNGYTLEPIQFTIRATLKPIQPYMHVFPRFGGIYSQTFFKDNRGLQCSGRYSLPMIMDQWINYEQQNANYQLIFNRQMDSLELQAKYQRQGDILNAITGTISGGMSGAFTGGMIGGGWGALAGGIVGTFSSGAAGAYDVSINQKLRADQIDLTADLHNLNLAAIKARPDTLTRISSIDIDSHIFPYVEIYTAADDEIEYLRNMLDLRGYSINRITTVQAQFNRMRELSLPRAFVSGKLIKAEEFFDDTHILLEVKRELEEGVIFT